MSYYSTYRWCAVPTCKNTSVKTPDKLWIKVPTDIDMRKTWFKVARRDPEQLSEKTRLYFCEDHFDLEKDMDNYMQYKIMGSVKRIRIKPHCVPSKFDWNKKRKRQSASKSHVAKTKKQKTSEETVQHNKEVSVNMSSSCIEGLTTMDVSSMENKVDNAVHIIIQADDYEATDSADDNDSDDSKALVTSNVCRVCLALDVKMYNLKDNELSEMFLNITGIAVTANHSVLESLCWECAARLKAAIAFRNKAMLSDTLLKGLVSTGDQIRKLDIASIKYKNKNLKSNLRIHKALHTVYIGEEPYSPENETPIIHTSTNSVIQPEDSIKQIKEEFSEIKIEYPDEFPNEIREQFDLLNDGEELNIERPDTSLRNFSSNCGSGEARHIFNEPLANTFSAEPVERNIEAFANTPLANNFNSASGNGEARYILIEPLSETPLRETTSPTSDGGEAKHNGEARHNGEVLTKYVICQNGASTKLFLSVPGGEYGTNIKNISNNTKSSKLIGNDEKINDHTYKKVNKIKKKKRKVRKNKSKLKKK